MAFTKVTDNLLSSGVGTGAGNILELDSSGKLPAVDGSLLTGGVVVDDGGATLQNILNIGGTDPQIRTDTSDGSDNKTLYLGGGGIAYNWNRGAFIHLEGNEAGGDVGITAGNVSGANIKFTTVGSEKLRIQSGGGISFNGDTTSANALDDYEEGTFTVGWTSTGNTFTPNSTTGYYTKVGNLVTVTYTAYMAGAPTIPNPTNGFTFTGLPFTSAASKYFAFTWGHHRWNEFPAGTNGLSLQLDGSATLITPYFRTGISELVQATALNWSRNGSGVRFTGSYLTS